MLKSRRDVASKLIDACTPYLGEAAQQEMSRAKNKIHQACDDCCNGLEANIRERRSIKGITRQVSRWLEPSPELLSFLLAQIPQEGKLAMHLSNLNGADITSPTAIVDVPTGRQIHANICGPPEEIERTLANWGKQPLLTWAPIDNGQLLKVAAAMRKLVACIPAQAPLVLVVPFDPYPACEHVTNFTDVWDHPLMHEKWQDVLMDINLIIPPTRIIVSGTHAPIHACKCLALFTLGRANNPAIPRLTSYRPKFFSFGSGPVIYVDVPAQFRFAVKSVISALNIPAVQAIDMPRNSLGSTKEVPRACIQNHIQAGKIPPLHMEALLRWLHTTLKDFQAIVGVNTSMSSPTAMLLDCISCSAGHTHGHLSWSSLVISPRLILVETRSAADTWHTNFTAAWNQDPMSSGLKLRYRPSAHIKTPFAQVAATAASIATVRARRGITSTHPTIRNPPTLQATISMSLTTTGMLSQWLPEFMHTVGTTNNLPLQKATTESGLGIHTWRAVMGYDGQWTGKIVVQLASVEEIRRVHSSLHGQGIEIQQHSACINVDSQHVDLQPAASAATQSP